MTGDREQMTGDILIANGTQEETVFQIRFSRCRQLLYFIATRVLGGIEQAEDAVERCWRTASLNRPWFEREGSFRSWLVRVLIDEALAIRDRDEKTVERKPSIKPIPPRALPEQVATKYRALSKYLPQPKRRTR
jgi:DNA-directed RNA polymerase specialized sigma24 family protein